MTGNARAEIGHLDHLGVSARQAIVTCRHGETVRVFVPQRHTRVREGSDLVYETAQEHEETYRCGCAQRMVQRSRQRRRQP